MARSISLREPTLVPPLSSVRLLSLHRFLFRFAFAGANIFAWIFIFQYFYLVEPSIGFGLARTALLYALSHTVTCLATPYAARLLVSGSRRVSIAAVVIAATSFVVLGASFAGFWGASYTAAALTFFSVGLGFYRSLYWIPYELEVEAIHRGRVGVLGELVIALAPLFAGFIIVTASLGPLPLLYAGSALMLLSALPLLYLPDLYEKFAWGYRETFGHFVAPENRAVVRHAVLDGMAGAGLLQFWPLALFLITGWSYGMLGVILTLTFFISILGRSFVRKTIRRSGLHTSGLLKFLFAVTPWAFRALVGTPLGAVLVDSYFHTTAPRRYGVDPQAFEQAADAGSYVDEYTALKEMGLAIGRIFLCLIATIAAFLVSLPAAFIVVFFCAALASAALALASR